MQRGDPVPRDGTTHAYGEAGDLIASGTPWGCCARSGVARHLPKGPASRRRRPQIMPTDSCRILNALWVCGSLSRVPAAAVACRAKQERALWTVGHRRTSAAAAESARGGAVAYLRRTSFTLLLFAFGSPPSGVNVTSKLTLTLPVE